jgi:TniQ
MALRLTIPLGDGETAVSLASRLAAANGTSAREFCDDFGIQFRQVVAGNVQAIAKIADLGGVDPDALQAQAFVRQGRRLYEVAGEDLTSDALCNRKIFGCPACLQDDIRKHPNLDPEVAIFGRASWMVDAVKTCRIHDRALVVIGRNSRDTASDFALNVQGCISKLPRLLAGSANRRPSGLENYVVDRLKGVARSEFLDGLELYAAIKFCEVVGAVALFGIRIGVRDLPDDKRLSALARGFEIVDGGPVSIREFLDGLMAAAGDRNRKDGPGAVFGRLHQWILAHDWDPAYAPVRAIFGQHVIDRFPLVIRTNVLGKLVAQQTRHSIRTLSLETGRHPKTLRKLLMATGIISDDQMALSDHNVTFDAQAATLAVAETSSRLYLPAVRAYLNAPRVQLDLLIKHGFIKPRNSIPGTYDQYAIDDLDAFLAELTMDAESVDRLPAGVADIPTAARKVRCSAADIVRLILARKLAWVGLQRGVDGYLSVLVNIDEVKLAVYGKVFTVKPVARVKRAKTKVTKPVPVLVLQHDGMTHREVCAALRTNYKVVLGLIANGHLADFHARNPINRHIQSLIEPAELERFKEAYVSLHALAKMRGQHHVVVRKEMDAVGIKPVFDHAKVHARFYRRRDCQQRPSKL